jgi:hypothetical protein
MQSMWDLGIIFGLVTVILSVAWFFTLKNLPSHADLNSDAKKFLTQSISTILSVSLGFSVFFLQGASKAELQKQSQKNALEEEIRVNMELIQEFQNSIKENPNLKLEEMPLGYFSVLNKATETAIFSENFDADIVHNLLVLSSLLEGHNKLASYGLKNVEKAPQFSKYLVARFQVVDNEILKQSQFIMDCLDGKNQLDMDCR